MAPTHQTVDEESKDYKYSAEASLSDSETVHDFVHEKGPTQLQTPGTSSSGYISEAFSTSNLTNDDSLSIKSNTGDFTPDKELDACDEQPVTDVSNYSHVVVCSPRYRLFILIIHFFRKVLWNFPMKKWISKRPSWMKVFVL